MDQIGAFLDEDWESLGRVFTFEEVHLNGWSFENLSNSWPIFDENTNMNVDECRSDALLSNFHSFSQESGGDSSGFFSHSQTYNNFIEPLVFSTSEDKRNTSLGIYFSEDYMGEMLSVKEDILIDELGNKNGQMKRKLTMPSMMNCSQHMSNTESFSMTSRKKPRVSVDTTSKKNKKSTSNSYAYSEDSDASRELNSGSMSKDGKQRRENGGATDSQSVYARKRREKINERLKTLQKLVPNGTKVDISTMLDEAVHYVKFLQLQIKLLSSDDKWMYSPIAYNGMDSGLHSI